MTLSGTAARRRWREKAIELLFTAVGFTGIAAVALIFLFVAGGALPLFTDKAQRAEAGVEKMFTPQPFRSGRPPAYVWQPVSTVPKVSMVPLWAGTLKVMLVSMLVAVPLALAAALFCSEFASRRLREWVKPAVELLAGVPSVVLGFFALQLLATPLQRLFGLESRLNALVAGVALAIAIVPVIFTVAE
ncbi:MAG TPA: phosphate ABC transporter permease subunit PstC, partial [Myxococcaceae bacterium]|nr:phosphate ABC transporter permease subunit PstC [Myxococcaceae bacterium]